MKPLRCIVATLLVAGLFFCSCGNRGTKGAEDSMDSAANLNRTKFNDSPAGMGTAELLVALYASGHYDAVVSGRISRQATDVHIKKFATVLGKQQDKLNSDIAEMASRKEVNLPEGLSTEQQQRLEAMMKDDAPDRGADYIRQLINNQKDALVILQQGARSTDTEIVGWAGRTISQVQSILDVATTARAYLDSLPAARSTVR